MRKTCAALASVWLIAGGACFSQAATSNLTAFADSPFIVDVWKTGPGALPQSSVISIAQSRDGYLWLGTLNGLVRFDGIRFVVFDEANLPGLISRRIVCLFEDSRTNLWVGTQADGIVVIRRDGTVQNLSLVPDERVGPLISITEDANRTIWLNSADGRLARFEGGKLELLNGRARPVVAEKAGLLWLGAAPHLLGIVAASNSPAFVVQYDLAVRKIDFLLPSRNGGLWRLADGRVQKWMADKLESDWGSYPWRDAQINAACEDLEGNLIVGTQDAGVYWYDRNGNAAQITSDQGLSHNTALSLCMDREGALWIGTDGGGLNRAKRKSFRVIAGSEGSTIQSVCDDGTGGFWFANLGGRLSHWKGGLLQQYDQQQGLLDVNMRSVLVEPDQTVWVGTAYGGLYRLPTGASAFERVSAADRLGWISVIYQDRTNRLWIGGQNGLLCRDGQSWRTYTTRDGLTTNDVRAIAEDTAENLWIGTQRGGLNCLRAGVFTSVRKSNPGLPSDNVSALWADADGVLWVGTSAGLARLHNGRWTRYTTREGLANNGIGCLIEDGQGNLWIGSYVGLMRLSKRALNDFAGGRTNSLVCRTYGEPDGLPTPECAQGSQPVACRTPDGRLWFATIKGLVTVDPSALRPNPYQPPVIIESVLVEGQEQITNQLSSGQFASVIVPPGREHLDIHYTSLNLGAANRARFKYCLQGHESSWTEIGDARVMRFSKLPQGHYVFQVTACNEDGVWSEAGSSLAITVLPPFWQTWWFLGILGACLVGVIVATVYFLSTQKLHRELAVMKQQEALEKERARIARDLHDQLGANLTQVALLGELAEADKHVPAEIGSHAKQISQTARETTRSLDEIVWAVNPSNDTLEGLITYVCKYAQEYLELAGLRYRLEVPTELPRLTIAPEVRHNVFLASKEAINNVVKHAQASTVKLRLRPEPDRFTLEIEDDGRGLAGMDGKTDRNGLRNMRKRMEDIGGSFTIVPAPERGALVRLTLPAGKQRNAP